MRNTLIDNPQGYYFSNRLGGIQTYHFLLVLQLLTKWKRKLKQKMLFPLLAPLGAMNLQDVTVGGVGGSLLTSDVCAT